jgi:hypothetical protein
MAKLSIKYKEFGITTEKTALQVEELSEVISHMDQFLRACGFVYDGRLDIVETIDDLSPTDRQTEFKFQC